MPGCGGPGCSTYPWDLSAAVPYVRFVLASSAGDAEGEFQGSEWTMSITNCEDKLEDQNVYAYKARPMNDYDDTVWKCQSFLLRELPGTAKQQTFAIQVPLPTTFHGWTNEGSNLHFRHLDPLWMPSQRFKFECRKTRQKGQSDWTFGRDCLIRGTKDGQDEMGLGVPPIEDVTEQAIEVVWGPCGEIDDKYGLWNIDDASEDFPDMPTYTYVM